nr:molybdate ABC transporter substrate-binding protein [Thalassobacillus sp. C254]
MWNEMEGKLVYGRNISDALSFVESGNAEAGIVALSLAPEEDYEFHLIDESLHNPLEQAIAVIDGTNAESEARNFLEFIKGPTGKPIMENYGFVVPEENQ